MVAVEEHLRKVKEAEERRRAEESDDDIVFSDEEDWIGMACAEEKRLQ